MNIVEMIIAIPMISVSEKLLESHTAEITQAETGSMLEMMLALVGPISRMPSRKNAYAMTVPKIIIAAVERMSCDESCGAVSHGLKTGISPIPPRVIPQPSTVGVSETSKRGTGRSV